MASVSTPVQTAVRVVPSLAGSGVTVHTATAGARASTMTCVGNELLPLPSATITLNTSPSEGAGNTGEQLKLPAASAVVVHSTLPLMSNTVTSPLGMVVPVTGSPSVGLTCGAGGAVVPGSYTVVDVGGLTNKPAWVAVTMMMSSVTGTGSGEIQIH